MGLRLLMIYSSSVYKEVMQKFKQWYTENFPQLKRDFFRFLRFPSISADPAYAQDVLQCAQFLVEYLQKGGFHAEQIPTSGYPIVYAEDLSAGPSKPTILIYGHYDVQPVDPLELWVSPPFEPTERDGKIFARGAVDDKGQIFYACLAAIAWKKLGLALPVNLKFCIEGEEESHSMGLQTALPALEEKLSAGSLLIVDFGAMEDGTPATSFGARGMASLEITLTGSDKDLHSGAHGGIAYNPNRALAELLASLWDANGRVAVPGFYDDALIPSQEELQAYTFLATPESVKRDFGIEALGGEKHHTLQESNWFYPVLEINGMSGGYTGPGLKTVIPAIAKAKISCRLVPKQDPDKVLHAIRDFLKHKIKKGIKLDIELHGGLTAFRGDPKSHLAKAVAAAATEVTGKPCKHILSGASIPIAAQLVSHLKAQAVGMGYGLATDDIHAPNEHFDWKRFEQGFLTVARAIERL